MDKYYQQFIKQGIDLAPLGIEKSSENTPYFCTPKGASIFGWAGVDGIHYCFIRGFGNMVFAVSPMNAAPDYVHPIAEDFKILLRLLLACGDATALVQAWQWDEAQFDTFLKDNLHTMEQKATISEIAEKMKLSLMKAPWEYLHKLQADFDYGKIKYPEDFYDPDMNADAEQVAPEWKVYYDGNFWGHHGRDRAGTEIKIGRKFQWAGKQWLIPAVYSCSKGLVVDICMRVEENEIRAFMEKWDLRWEDEPNRRFTREQEMQMELENPLHLNFEPQLEVNGRSMEVSHGCCISFNPCLPDGVIRELEAKWVIEHYGLDTSYGWVIFRNSFPWNSKRRPEIKTLTLTMQQQPEAIPGLHFKVHAPGDTFVFSHPTSKKEYTLTVQEMEQQTMPENRFGSDRWEYPTYYTAMSYTLSPEPEERITVSDCEDGEKPKEKRASSDLFDPVTTSSVACIGIIGGADGPTSIVFGGSKQGMLYVACSALHFEPVKDIEWRITFHEKYFEDCSTALI